MVRQTHASLLKERGFRKRGRSLVLALDDLYHVVNFQGRQWRSASHGQFTINLMVIWPYFHERYRSRPMPSNPASGAPAIWSRIGFFMPEHRDHWWHVDRNTQVELLSAEIQFVLEEFGLPFLARFDNVSSLVAQLREGIDVQHAPCSPEYLRAAAHCYAGARAAAKATLLSMLSPNRPQPWDDFVRALMHNLGLEK